MNKDFEESLEKDDFEISRLADIVVTTMELLLCKNGFESNNSPWKVSGVAS